MCKAKADGGTRCQYHLKQGVQGGLTAYAAASTGLSTDETSETYNDLQREGQHLPDPSRDEVDAFLTAQEFHVRHDVTLSEAKRTSILSRLRAAIGRVLPDGATFHAWKNLVGAAWARARRAIPAITLSAILAVGACGHATPAATPAGPSRSQTSTSAPAAPAPAATVQAPVIDKISVPADVARKFGAGEVRQAYQDNAQWALRSAFDDEVLHTPVKDLTTADLAGPRDQFTASARADYDRTVHALVNGGEGTQAQGDVGALTYMGIEGQNGWHVRNDVNPVVASRVGSPVAKIETDGRLCLTYTVTGTIRALDGQGKPQRLMPVKTMQVWLKKEGGRYLVDGYSAQIQSPVKAAADTK